MMKLSVFSFFYVLFLPLLSIQGQPNSTFFSTLTNRNGLPSNLISAVAQDHHKFIWIGTSNGLCRYDGYHFKIFKREDSETSLIDNEISALLADGEYLWVGTWRGLCKINTVTFAVERIDIKDKAAIRAFYKDRHDNVWIGTTNGLIRYSKSNGTYTRFTAETNNLSHNTIRTIFEDTKGNLWVGTYDKLNKLTPGALQFKAIDLKRNYKAELKNNLIMDVKPVEGSDSTVWVGTETGLYELNINTGFHKHYANHNVPLSNEVIKTIYTDRDGNLWLGTDFGLNIFNPVTRSVTQHFHNPQLSYSLANNVIWQIFEDDGEVIWFATSNGLSRINKHKNYYQYHEVTHRINDQTIGNQIKAILASHDGHLWMATLHGVVRLHPSTEQRKIFNTESPANERILLNNVSTLMEDNLGRIWIGTAGGINIWDAKREKMYSITAQAANGLTSNYISKFTQAKDGSLWVSAWEGGLFKAVQGWEDPENMRFEYVGDFSSPRTTYALNALWSIHNNELSRIDLNTYVTKKVRSFNEAAKGKDIYTLHYVANQSIWAGTQNGLIEYSVQSDSATFHPIITGNEVQFNNMASDHAGNIWMAASNFVLKFNTSNQHTEIFPLDKDLPLRSFSSNCVTAAGKNNIIFGGDNGYIIIDTNLTPHHYKPELYLTAFQINNKPVAPYQRVGEQILLDRDISFTKELVLEYAQRSIAFEFATLHYWQPDNNVYAYKLEGFDADWNYVSGLKNFAVYSNLSPGTYTLTVKGTNNFGLWTGKVAQLMVTVKPPLFLSLPFLSAYAVIVILLVVVAFRIYIIRLKLNNALKLARMEKEHAEDIVQTKQQFFTNISHELRTPISLIIPPIQQILKKGNLDEETHSLMTIAEKNSQRLLRLINQILDFRKLEHENKTLTITWFDLVSFTKELYSLFSDKAARNEIEFVFNTNVKECALWADKEKLEIIIFNLLSNAFKFTPKRGRIVLSLSQTEPCESFKHGAVAIKVVDTGIGIAKEEQAKIFEQFYQTKEARTMEDGSGIGLTLVAEYTRLHKGEITVDSIKGKGTCFTVCLPLGDSHFPIENGQQKKEIDLLVTKSSEEKAYQFDLRTTKPLILLTEDNPDMISLLEVSLQHKYNFVSADNGEEALVKAHSFLPDVIISDIMMPVMDGLTFCKRIKQDNKTSHIPIILLTAKSLTAHKIEGIRVGADIYITKPFEIELLEAHIDHLLERQAELAEYFKNELITAPLNPAGKENEDDKFLKKVMNTIEANISNSDFGVEMLSEEMGMSSTHLYRKLKSLTHLSANEIIKRYRIKKASLLLKNKEGNISEIMYEVGFSSLSYFSKCFKSEFGVTPKEYQQRESKHIFNIEDKLL